MPGYERKSIQILGGGFNCLAPVDKIPITDAMLLQNFRTDSLGRFISRPGYATKFQIPNAGIAHSASSGGGMGSPLYVGANSAIAAPITSSVYFNGGAVPIASGFDGNRIGFASQNGFMYVMNRGAQGRHSAATGWEAWNLTAPPVSPAASTAVSPVTQPNVVYVFALQGDPTYLHFITIGGVTYSIAENGYSAAQIPLVLSLIANADANATVTYAGDGMSLIITPIAPFTLVAVSASDGNAPASLAAGSVTTLPNGTYRYYLTYQSADLTLESNPGPSSLPVSTTGGQAINVIIGDNCVPTDARVGFINIYRTGGTEGSAYRVGQFAVTSAAAPWVAGTAYLAGAVVTYGGIGGVMYVAIAASTGKEPDTSPLFWTGTFTDSMSDLSATNNGQIMPTQNDPPPAASGIIGPFFSILFAWSTVAHKNRLFFTQANLPQYWRGSADEQVGDWVDVGADDEAIVWCTLHSNLVVIYKERSIWLIIGSSPSTATLECIYDGIGLANAFALAPAGQIDYFIAPNGLCLFDMSQVHVLAGNIQPLFNQSITNAGPQTPPGSVLPGSAFNANSTAVYAIALGHAMGRLYVAYAEKT